MHEFFNEPDVVQHGIPRYAGQQWIRDGLKRNLGQAISFYRRNPMAVSSSHFLVRLLQSIDVSHQHPLERYFDLVDSMALNLSMALKMTSSIFAGHVFDGVFYGPGNHELLIAHTSDFDFEEAHRNWANVEAVKVLRCPRSDLGLNLPDGSSTGSETGWAVLAINIPMLAVQYRAFRLDQQTVGDSEKSVMQFVHMYVLPNMLWSQTDHVVFNRLNKLSRDAQLGESLQRHSFAMPLSYNEKFTDFLVSVLKDLRHQQRTWAAMLSLIPAVTLDNMQQVMRLPQMAPTRQVLWALNIARLPMLEFVFRIARDEGSQRNGSQQNQVERSMLALRYGHVFEQYLPPELRMQIQREIDDIMRVREVTP